MSFENLNLIPSVMKALEEEGYRKPTPIQAEAIPFILEQKDLLGCAQTGTGKTAAFAIPMIQMLHKEREEGKKGWPVSALILTPTRELAIQIGESFGAYGKYARVRHTVIFGGVSQRPQVLALKRGVDVIIATPGRLLDLMQQGYIRLGQLRYLVLDEADRMLDMGFIHDIKRIIAKLPAKRQTLFFSATMPREIERLSENILTNPVKVAVTPVSSTVDTIRQNLYYVSRRQKQKLLTHLLESETMESVLIFSRTKHGANRIVKDLAKDGIFAAAIHGNKSQTARQKALKGFKSRTIRVLVATDIASRGIDVDQLSHVINFDLPEVAETYVHRIGRTGRAGLSGVALSFCDFEEKGYLKSIEKLIGQKIDVIRDHPFHGTEASEIKSQVYQGHRYQTDGQGGGNNKRHYGGSRRPTRNSSYSHTSYRDTHNT